MKILHVFQGWLAWAILAGAPSDASAAAVVSRHARRAAVAEAEAEALVADRHNGSQAILRLSVRESPLDTMIAPSEGSKIRKFRGPHEDIIDAVGPYTTTICGLLFLALMGSVPFILAYLLGEANITRAHIIESVCLISWLVFVIFMFTNVLKFNSPHWEGSRTLTIVESVYLLSQILTTVGYGDIVPAFPRGQVWVAVNVVLALCLYGSIIMEVSTKLSVRIEQYFGGSGSPEEEDTQREVDASQPLKDWNSDAPLDLRPLSKAASAFVFATTVGVFFWHYYPGEEKTWLEAVYFSIITLSTVGFGYFTATTGGGMVFGAFWMLFGVATLVATVAAWIDLMSALKEKERKHGGEAQLAFLRLTREFTAKLPDGDEGMDAYDFLTFGLVYQNIITREELKDIERRFSFLGGDETGSVALSKVATSEQPPVDLQEAARRNMSFLITPRL